MGVGRERRDLGEEGEPAFRRGRYGGGPGQLGGGGRQLEASGMRSRSVLNWIFRLRQVEQGNRSAPRRQARWDARQGAQEGEVGEGVSAMSGRIEQNVGRA